MVIRASRPLPPRVGEIETLPQLRASWTVLRVWDEFKHPIRMAKIVRLAHRYGVSPQFCVYVETQYGLLHGPRYFNAREQADEAFDNYVHILATELAKEALGLNRI